MEHQIIDIIKSHINKLEEKFKEDISEIKSDIKVLKETQIKLAEVIVKLSTIEDKYNAQMAMCKEARAHICKIDDRVDFIEKKFAPIERFFEEFSTIKRNIIVGISLALLSALGTLVVSLLKWIK